MERRLDSARKVQREAERQLERLDALLREGMTLDEWRRVAAPPQADAAAAVLAIEDLTAEREQVEATTDLVDATAEFMERITALRAAVAGEIVSAEGIAAIQAALRRVFTGFVLHDWSSENAPRRSDIELVVDGRYVLQPRVRDDALNGVMPAGTPLLKQVPLELEAAGGINDSPCRAAAGDREPRARSPCGAIQLRGSGRR